MTQEDKDLLLKDLCARLPYEVKIQVNDKIETVEGINILDNIVEFGTYMACDIDEVKPYLFPMSSMTEEQKKELSNEMCYLTHSQIEGRNPNGLIESTAYEIDFYNKHHIDYRGLIEKGLANDATGLGIYEDR